MKISYRWLGRHLDLEGKSAHDVREDLTMSTAEVEGVTALGSGLEQILVGLVVECGRHPDADKLSVTKVDVGSGDLVTIVCGAPNVAAGQKVAVALPGVTLPGDDKPLKKAKLRGVESHGMICSERELQFSDEHHGIMVLDKGAQVGQPLTEVMPLADWVIEIDNKSINHRPDLWGHRGIARELAAIWGRRLRPMSSPVPLPEEGETRPVVIDDLAACPRYCGLIVRNVEVRPSPAWLAALLRAVGLRPINNLVDLTNFVMLDLGQPMHAFDLRHIADDGVRVRFARAGETMRTLDGVERKLEERDLLITSGDRPVGLAGVMGGEKSMVEADTTTLFLEAATFHPATVRRTSVRLGLRTDSSARFEKSLDPANAELAIHAYLRALADIGAPGAPGALVDPADWRYEPRRVTLRKARLARKLGVDLPAADVARILTSLDFDVREYDEHFEVGVPSFRATKDVAIEDDLVEEVGRMHRYDNIPEQPLAGTLTVPVREPELWLARTLVKDAATELACHEVYDYTFVPDAVLAACGAEVQAYVEVANPVAPEIRKIRRHVMPSLLASLAGNQRHAAEVRLVELGKGYDSERRVEGGLPAETLELAFAWSRAEGDHPYAELRSGVESLLRRIGCPHEVRARAEVGDRSWIHPGRTAAITAAGRELGYVGAVRPDVLQRLGLPAGCAVANLDLRAILGAGLQARTMSHLPRFPSQPVDVALIVPAATPVADVEAFLRSAGKKLVREVVLFEVYRGDRVPEGTKSLNFTVVLGADDRTLVADDEARFLARVREQAGTIGATLRG
ncbi:MAG: phenylalanine--tRNA ligase subunit beta [Planctomycetota bacterium]